MGRHEQVVRWVVHSYLSREIHTGRWVGGCVLAYRESLLNGQT